LHDRPSTLLIACGALSADAIAVLKQPGLDHVKLTCLPAKLHNTPGEIPELLQDKIRQSRKEFSEILVLYGDCGTAGAIDKVLVEEKVRRIGGAHCYEFFAGSEIFRALSEEEPGSFYLTDFLTRHFDSLVWKGLGLEAHPELLPLYFGNYTRLVYLAQSPTDELIEKAKLAASRLELKFEYRKTGLFGIENFLAENIH